MKFSLKSLIEILKEMGQVVDETAFAKNAMAKLAEDGVQKTAPITWEKAADDKSRVRSFIMTREVVDRDGDLVFIDGISRKDGAVPFLQFHDRWSDPVGKVIEIQKGIDEKGKFMRGIVEFATTPEADKTLMLYDGGFITDVSISFLPTEYVFNAQRKGYDIHKCELLELSKVIVGSNPGALIESAPAQPKENETQIDKTVAERIEGIREKLFAAECGSSAGLSNEALSRIESIAKSL